MPNGLDILTLVAISLIFMVEMFLLLSRSLEARLQDDAIPLTAAPCSAR